MQKNNKIIVSILVMILLVAGIIFFINKKNASVNNIKTVDTSQAKMPPLPKKTITEFSKTVPIGFPSGIPIESANIISSNKAVYVDSNVTQYTVSYTSTKSKDSLFKLYTDYFTSAGYTMNKDSINKTLGFMSVSKGKNSLMVGINNSGQESVVHLNLLVH